jgi:hypothetical protein
MSLKQGLHDDVEYVLENFNWNGWRGRYRGQVRDTVPHGYGAFNGMGRDIGFAFEGEWRGGRINGGGVFCYPSGGRYSGEWRDDAIHGHGILWLRDERLCFHGSWCRGRPIRGTLHEADGSLFLVSFDGNTPLLGDGTNWTRTIQRTPAGRVLMGGPPPASLLSGGGIAPDWKGKVELGDGGVYEGVVRGLCPYGEAIFNEANSARRQKMQNDGRRTFGEIMKIAQVESLSNDASCERLINTVCTIFISR